MAICVVLLCGIPRNGSALASAGDVKVAALKPSLVSTGIKNLGNTCYLNSQLQCAFHIPAVRHIALAEPKEQPVLVEGDDEEEPVDRAPAPQPDNNMALIALRELFTSMVMASESNLPAVIPRSFCMRLGIPVMEQQDSQEFWKLLLPAVQLEELSDLYKGSFEDYITALDGSGRERRREELFLDLSLDIASRSVLYGCVGSCR